MEAATSHRHQNAMRRAGAPIILTSHERDVLAAAAHGEVRWNTARRLHFSEATIARLRRSACAALGAHDVHEAIVLADERGLLHGGEGGR